MLKASGFTQQAAEQLAAVGVTHAHGHFISPLALTGLGQMGRGIGQLQAFE